VGERGASRSEATGQGSVSADRDPSSVADCVRVTFSRKGRRKKKALHRTDKVKGLVLRTEFLKKA
jgi:hypothetical protein